MGWNCSADCLSLLKDGTTQSSSSKIHAPLEVAKGYHVGYIKAKINVNLSKPKNPVLHHCQCELCFWHVMDRTIFRENNGS